MTFSYCCMAEDRNWFENLIGIDLALDQFILLAIIIAGLTKKKSFFKDWVPFLIFWFTYDLMRSVADDNQHINVSPIYDLELKLFGWMFDGKIPAFWSQNHQFLFFDVFFAIYYSMHMVAPIIIASLIYYKSKDRYLFKEFSYAFLLTSYLALLTFYFYPVAPPWYIWNESNGLNFGQPVVLTRTPGSAAGLVEVDRLLGINLFGRIYGRFNSNPYAALPSLHAAYSSITAYYAIKKYGQNKRVRWVLLYPFGVFAAAVYLNHHFIVDLILGVFYTLISIKSIRVFRNIRERRRNVETQSEELDNEQPNNGKEISKLQIVELKVLLKPEIESK